MKWTRTLRARFALWTTGLLLVVLFLFGVVVYVSMQQSLARSIDDALRLSASQAIAAVNIENGQINFNDSLPDVASTTDLQARGLTIRILSPDGQMIQSTGPFQYLPIDQTSLQHAGMGKSEYGTLIAKNGDQVRIYTASIIENGKPHALIQVMQNMASIKQTLDRLLFILLICTPLLLILSAFSGYFLAARALAPIDQITRTAQHISAEDLTARLNLPATEDEVGRLASTFDQMLSRLEGAFKRERQFTADASHELRTPMTATQAIINVMREKRRKPEDYEKALDDIADETERLRTMTENLLYIARGQAWRFDQNEIINVSDLLADVAESLKPIALNKGLEFEWTVSTGLSVEGDSDALIRLFVNLIDNAVKYTHEGSIQLLAMKTETDQVQVSLIDTGIGIAADHLPHIFERFYRVEASRTTRGAGLGLSIVKEIVEAHHGKVEVTSQVGKGTCFQLSFPSVVDDALIGNPKA